MDNKPDSIQPGRMPDSGYKTQDDTRDYLSLVGLFAVLFVAVILFGYELAISMKSGNMAQGLSSVPWVGLRNYEELFRSIAFTSLLRNTFVFNLLFAGMSFTFAVLLGYFLTALPKMLKGILTAFFGLLLFLPAEVFVGWVIQVIGSELLVNPAAMRFFYPFICSVKYLGIPLILAFLRDEIYIEKDSLTPVKAAGLFASVSLIFISSSFFTMTNAIYNSLTYSTMDMLDTYAFRKGLLEMNAGTNAAVGILQIFITIVSAAVLFVPVLTLFRSTFNGERKDLSADSVIGKLVSSVIAFVLFAVLFFLPYMSKGYSFNISQLSQNVNLLAPIINFLLVSAISAAIAAALAVGMSKAFLSTNRSIKITAGTILTLTTVLYISPYKFSSYMLIRNLGLFNTFYAIIVLTCFSTTAVWAMVCIQRSERRITGNSLLLSALALFLIQTALVYGNSALHTIYLNQPKVSPLLILRQLSFDSRVISGSADRTSYIGLFGLYGFLASLPPLLLFLATYVFLPKDKLLAVISAGLKN